MIQDIDVIIHQMKKGNIMGAKETMTEMLDTINAKTKEYAPIVKEKLVNAYHTSKDFTVDVIIPKMKSEVESLKTTIANFQEKQKEKEKEKTTIENHENHENPNSTTQEKNESNTTKTP